MPRSRTSRRSAGKHLKSFFSHLAQAARGPASDLARAFKTRSTPPVYLLEPLEERLQFVVLGGPLNKDDGVFEFLDAKLNTIRVAWHDMTFELFGSGVGTTESDVTISE